ncbi:MAG: hypothetical protein FWB75_05895 [Oscillospiraceae bacterium]|nr:hypothetical protein [Oscillospiraceae bacterium]
MKKLNLIVIRDELDNFLHELISLGCVEVTEPEAIPAGSDLLSGVVRELLDISGFGATQSELPVLGTKHTVFIVCWIPSQLEDQLIPIFDNYVCAWEITNLGPEDIDIAPAELNLPRFFPKYRLAGRKIFTPLKLAEQESIIDEDEEII